jgi:alkylated DNA repair dioxygenase AlkB
VAAYTNNNALPVPPELCPYWDWAVANIDSRLNGLLLNWYDCSLGHYIGKHRDSTYNMIDGAPIVTVSFGEARVFRMRPWRTMGGYKDFVVKNGSVIIMPYQTNQSWTHEIVKSKKLLGQRISLTLRAFEELF